MASCCCVLGLDLLCPLSGLLHLCPWPGLLLLLLPPDEWLQPREHWRVLLLLFLLLRLCTVVVMTGGGMPAENAAAAASKSWLCWLHNCPLPLQIALYSVKCLLTLPLPLPAPWAACSAWCPPACSYINGKPFVVREAERPFSNLEYTGIDRARVEGMEARLKADVLQEVGPGGWAVQCSAAMAGGRMAQEG